MCLLCKGGRNLCGKGRCEVLDNARRVMPSLEFKSNHIFGDSPPSVFVGRYGYPKVNAGPMLPSGPMENSSEMDMKPDWWGRPVEDIIARSSSLIRPARQVKVTKPFSSGRFLEVTHSLAMSEKPVQTEVFLEKPPSRSRGIFSFVNTPLGPSLKARKAELTENPSIPRQVDALVDDSDAGAVTAMRELHARRVDEHAIQKLLSVGLLGKKSRRRLVPTRWAITAVDDSLGKELIPSVMDLQHLGEYQLFTSNYAGNYFHVLLLPGVWSYEMREVWLKGSMWAGDKGVAFGEKVDVVAGMSDYEDFRGRKSYASKITGAYYSARLRVLQHMLRMKRQASALVYREITDEYWAPLGVWVIRESVGKALSGKPRTFDTMEKAVSAMTKEVRVKRWADDSWLLKQRKEQKRLDDFL